MFDLKKLGATSYLDCFNSYSLTYMQRRTSNSEGFQGLWWYHIRCRVPTHVLLPGVSMLLLCSILCCLGCLAQNLKKLGSHSVLLPRVLGSRAYRVRGYQGTQGLEDRRRLGFRCKALASERWFQGRGFQGLWVSRAVGGS